jgi:2-polyprenyl-3-methyl-5-hydroxy-6-metoxy-1,4-benzoquinol methylase
MDSQGAPSHCRCIDSRHDTCQAQSIGSKNGFIILDCKACGHGYIKNAVTEELLQKYYSNSAKYVNSSFHVDLARQRYPGSRSDAMRYLGIIKKLGKKNGHIRMLEVGAGWGYASEAASKMGWQADAIEYSRVCAASLAERLPSASRIHQGSFEEFCESETPRYDAILMSQVLEHAINPIQWLSSAYSLLSVDGVLLVAVPLYRGLYRFSGLNDPFIIPPEHLSFFSKKSLRRAALDTGFRQVCSFSYSRIPYFNILHRFKAPLPSIIVYRLLQFVFWFLDRGGVSMVQVQVFAK